MLRQASTILRPSEVPAELAEIVNALEHGDLSGPMKECARAADQEFARNFSAQAGPNSGPWAPRKQRGSGKVGDKNSGHPLEIKSGAMFLAATSDFGEGHIEQVGERSAEIGIDPGVIPYAAAQNYGHVYQSPSRVLPQRQFMDVSEGWADQQAEAMADGIAEIVG